MYLPRLQVIFRKRNTNTNFYPRYFTPVLYSYSRFETNRYCPLSSTYMRIHIYIYKHVLFNARLCVCLFQRDVLLCSNAIGFQNFIVTHPYIVYWINILQQQRVKYSSCRLTTANIVQETPWIKFLFKCFTIVNIYTSYNSVH